jgi:hypothetical protein
MIFSASDANNEIHRIIRDTKVRKMNIPNLFFTPIIY